PHKQQSSHCSPHKNSEPQPTPHGQARNCAKRSRIDKQSSQTTSSNESSTRLKSSTAHCETHKHSWQPLNADSTTSPKRPDGSVGSSTVFTSARSPLGTSRPSGHAKRTSKPTAGS